MRLFVIALATLFLSSCVSTKTTNSSAELRAQWVLNDTLDAVAVTARKLQTKASNPDLISSVLREFEAIKRIPNPPPQTKID